MTHPHPNPACAGRATGAMLFAVFGAAWLIFGAQAAFDAPRLFQLAAAVWAPRCSSPRGRSFVANDVLFFRADDKYTCVHLANAEHLIRVPIAELVAQLDPDLFWQVHRSTVVNLAHVAGTRRDELSRLYIRLRGHAAELPVSRAYVHLFKAM